MQWFIELFSPGNSSLAATILLYSFVISAGLAIGKIRVGGISLGTTLVLFVGLLVGHFGYMANGEVLHFVREFGLILFILAIGMEVGPGFVSSFRKGGVRLNLLAALIVALDVVIVVAAYYLKGGETTMATLVGVMSGAVTNTPGLGAASQALQQVSPAADISQMAMGYAAAYPLGVLGIILAMLIIKKIYNIDIEAETLELEKSRSNAKRRSSPNLIPLFVGIFLGVLLGSVPVSLPGMSVPMKLGLAGGPLVVAIIISALGCRIRPISYTSSTASLFMRELGMCLFLSSVGLASGAHFWETVFNAEGLAWVFTGFVVTLVPLLIVGTVARSLFSMNFLQIIGLLSGGMTDPPALAYATNSTGQDAPTFAYSTVYPLTMFLRIIVAQLLVVLFI